MKVKIFTTFPEFYQGFLSTSIVARAIANGLLTVQLVDIMEYGLGGYRRVDDYSYGGGGMVMRPDVLGKMLDEHLTKESRLYVTSPRGKVFTQKKTEELAGLSREICILCNRFEGVDQRIIDYYKAEEISIGDYVLCGGELASCVIIETSIRLCNGVLLNQQTALEESFSESLNGGLEYDHYTKPSVWQNISVPQVLLSGNHAQIKHWRNENSKHKTNERNNST